MTLAKQVIAFAVVACALFGSLNSAVLECPQICPDLYDPICATDGKSYIEFANQCDFNASQCLYQKAAKRQFHATSLDLCRAELVGSLDKLLTKLGDLDLTKSGCLKPCSLNYKPICISNGKYRFLSSNPCIMNVINCALGNKDSFKVVQEGSC